MRSELDDVNTIISPPRGRVAAELVKAPYVRHMVRYDRATQDYDQGPGSGRLVHYAVAGGQRALVAAYLAEAREKERRAALEAKALAKGAATPATASVGTAPRKTAAAAPVGAAAEGKHTG